MSISIEVNLKKECVLLDLCNVSVFSGSLATIDVATSRTQNSFEFYVELLDHAAFTSVFIEFFR
jgi:hypothetical protein